VCEEIDLAVEDGADDVGFVVGACVVGLVVVGFGVVVVVVVVVGFGVVVVVVVVVGFGVVVVVVVVVGFGVVVDVVVVVGLCVVVVGLVVVGLCVVVVGLVVVGLCVVVVGLVVVGFGVVVVVVVVVVGCVALVEAALLAVLCEPELLEPDVFDPEVFDDEDVLELELVFEELVPVFPSKILTNHTLLENLCKRQIEISEKAYRKRVLTEATCVARASSVSRCRTGAVVGIVTIRAVMTGCVVACHSSAAGAAICALVATGAVSGCGMLGGSR